MRAEFPEHPVFRVSVLKPISLARARVLESWVTDGAGAIDALEAPGRLDLAVQIEIEDWAMGLGPEALSESWSGARRTMLQ